MTDSNASDTLRQAAEAARKGDLTTLDTLLDKSPGLIHERDDNGETLLHHACRAATGDIAIPRVDGTPEQHRAVGTIIAAGSDLNATTPDGWSPLHTAAMSGHVDLARRLLAAGARRDGNLMGASGGSALPVALFYAKTAVGEVLADPATPDNLRHAAALGRDLGPYHSEGVLNERAATGLDCYKPIAAFPDWNRTYERQEILDEALTWAARNSQIASMMDLVSLGADVNSNAYRGTPLLWAIYADSVSAATWLLDHGADPDLRHDFGGAGHGVNACAIHLAAQHDRVNCLPLLLERGANPGITDDAYNATARGWAEFSGAQNALTILAEFGA